MKTIIITIICLLTLSVNAQNAQEAQEAQTKYTVKNVSFTMKEVKGGTFTMGCTNEQGDDCKYDESPAHSATVSDYYIGETEVTQALWEAVMGDNPSHYQKKIRKAYANRENYPVEGVSWNDIVGVDTAGGTGYIINGVSYYKDGFCYRLTQLVGGDKKFRLPTEAEWEYAARGGSVAEKQTKYSGSDNIDDVAWHWNNIPSRKKRNAGFATQPVGTKNANALGLYDMSGNVWEWCSDWYDYYDGSDYKTTIPVERMRDRIKRGGGWTYYDTRYFRVSTRNSSVMINYGGGIDGFRLAL